MNQAALPRVLLLSEATLSDKGGGINRILFNLLSHYPEAKLCVLSNSENQHARPTSSHINCIRASFEAYSCQAPKNVLGSVLAPFVAEFNLLTLKYARVECLAEIQAFKPDILLLCTNQLPYFVLGHELRRRLNCQLVLYAMDDWLGFEQVNWIGAKRRKFFNQLLSECSGLLTVSPELLEVMRSRYNQGKLRGAVVPNPAPDNPNWNPPKCEAKAGLKLAYAGSVWEMHRDAFLAVAQAAQILRERGFAVDFTFYGERGFFESLNGSGLTYGEELEYEALLAALANEDLLVVCSSFKPSMLHLSRTSLQTKLMDYLGVGRAVFSCGPEDAAVSKAVEAWGAGYCAYTLNPEAIANQLEIIQADRAELARRATRAKNMGREQFSGKLLRERMFSFLQECAS